MCNFVNINKMIKIIVKYLSFIVIAAATNVFRPPSRCQSLSLSDVLFNDNASNHGSIYSEPAYIVGKAEQEKICDNCRQSMSRPATASYWYPSSVAHLASPRRFCGKLGECNISSLRHPDGASNPNLKEEIERIPGNGASGSDPEEEYIEAKKLFITAERSERTVTGKSDIEEETKVPGNDFHFLEEEGFQIFLYLLVVSSSENTLHPFGRNMFIASERIASINIIFELLRSKLVILMTKIGILGSGEASVWKQ